jgi:hypothetical protein
VLLLFLLRVCGRSEDVRRSDKAVCAFTTISAVGFTTTVFFVP